MYIIGDHIQGNDPVSFIQVVKFPFLFLDIFQHEIFEVVPDFPGGFDAILVIGIYQLGQAGKTTEGKFRAGFKKRFGFGEMSGQGIFGIAPGISGWRIGNMDVPGGIGV